MFYKLDTLTNRLSRTSQLQANNPAGLRPSNPDGIKEVTYIFESTKVRPATIESGVQYTTASTTSGGKPLGIIPALDGYARLVDYQKKWQIADGLMVWQKRGMRDMGPYYVTLAGCALGTLYGFYCVWQMSFPKKAE